MEQRRYAIRRYILLLSMIISCLAFTQPLTGIEITIPQIVERPDARIAIPVNIGNATGLGIISIEFTLEYESNILTPTSVSILDSVPSSSGWVSPIYRITTGQVTVWMADFDELVGEGTLVRVSFNVSESADKGDSTQLSLINVYLNEGNVPVTIDNGSFTVVSNTAPVSNGQTVTTNEDTSIGINLTGSDVDGDPLTYHIVDEPPNGSLTGTAPNLTYIPELNFNGSYSFTFKVNDGSVDSNIATVIITVNPVNDPPVAYDQFILTDEDTPIDIILTGSDVDGDPLTYHVVDDPSYGSLSGTAPNLTYTPNPSFKGSDSFTFEVNDGNADSDPATISIAVGSDFFSCALEQSWNLISLPLQPPNTDPIVVLSSIAGQYNSVWDYDPDTGWSVYVPGAPSDLQEIVSGKGYWIKMNSSETLVVQGTVPESTEVLLKGAKWNLAGYCSLDREDVGNCNLPDCINSVWGYNADTGWSIYAPGWIIDLETMKPGFGYWIKVEADHPEDCVWDVDQLSP